MTSKAIEKKYKKLSDQEHVLLRPGRYLGSVKPHTALTWVYEEDSQKIIKQELTWNPALLKIVDEVISNSVDEFKRKGSKLNTIKIDINQDIGEFKIWDNGGIPVVIHPEHNEYVPELIFKNLKAGSNFDDTEESTGTGQNGEGAGLTNIFSTKFVVKTCDGKKKFRQVFENNLHKVHKPTISSSTYNHTEISFIPDYERLESTLDTDNYQKIIKRIYDISGCNPKLKLYLNGKKIQINSFKDYISLYTTEFIYEENENWRIGISSSVDGFEHNSFVNGEHTVIGGTHIEYVSNQIVAKLREFFKKKHKVEIKPAVIRNHMTLFMDATIINPRYSSQTKDELITEPKEYKTSYVASDKFIKKILTSPIIEDVLRWVEAKALQQEAEELRKLNKDKSKANPKKIIKFSDANEKKDRSKCMLFLAEGDGAAKAVNGSSDRMTMGNYPLKGKPINVNDIDTKKLIANVEFTNIMTIMGLQIGVPVNDPKDLYFGKLVIFADQDLDGFHICGLVINMLHNFWPELFELGIIYRFKTPLIRVWAGKGEWEFFNEKDFGEWKEENKDRKYKSKYYKGLGGFKTSDFKKYLNNVENYLIPLTIDGPEDTECIDLAFNKARADDRKIWLGLEEK